MPAKLWWPSSKFSLKISRRPPYLCRLSDSCRKILIKLVYRRTQEIDNEAYQEQFLDSAILIENRLFKLKSILCKKWIFVGKQKCIIWTETKAERLKSDYAWSRIERFWVQDLLGGVVPRWRPCGVAAVTYTVLTSPILFLLVVHMLETAYC